jgi:hypothetical protein
LLTTRGIEIVRNQKLAWRRAKRLWNNWLSGFLISSRAAATCFDPDLRIGGGLAPACGSGHGQRRPPRWYDACPGESAARRRPLVCIVQWRLRPGSAGCILILSASRSCFCRQYTGDDGRAVWIRFQRSRSAPRHRGGAWRHDDRSLSITLRNGLVNAVLVMGAMGANGRTASNPRGYQVEKSALAETNQLFRPTATIWVACLRSK